jgi:Protein of unknown function (DUF2783)
MTPSLTTRELEDFYDALAEAIDRAGDKSPLFLAKLALKLALDVGDPKILMAALQVASQDLTGPAAAADDR